MSATVSMSGADTFIINGRVLTDFADADNGTLTYPSKIMDVKKGKNDNSIFAYNNQGRMAEMKLRLILGSEDDKFLLQEMTTMENSVPTYVLLTGQFIKVVGGGRGSTTNVTYNLASGVVAKRQEAKSNSDGDAAQSVVEYDLTWAQAIRTIS